MTLAVIVALVVVVSVVAQLAEAEIRTLCISEVSCSSVGEAVALRVSVPLTGEFRLT